MKREKLLPCEIVNFWKWRDARKKVEKRAEEKIIEKLKRVIPKELLPLSSFDADAIIRDLLLTGFYCRHYRNTKSSRSQFKKLKAAWADAVKVIIAKGSGDSLFVSFKIAS
jgi:hypothetical protein